MEDLVLRKLRRLAEEFHMLPPGGLILTAVSGGADSMCLLHALLTLRDQASITVAAAHFNHQLRPEAEAEAAFVRDWCAAQGVPLYTGQADVAKQAADRGTGIEETARLCATPFWSRRRRRSAQTNRHRPSGRRQRRDYSAPPDPGQRPPGPGGDPAGAGRMIRPLLTVERREIEAYLSRHGVPHVEDASNNDTTYRRNYLRWEILPRLEALNPRLHQRLWESSCQFRREDAYLDGQARTMLTELTRLPEGVTLARDAVTALPEALSLRGIQLLAREVEPEVALSAAHRQAVLDLCRSPNPSGQVHLPGGLLARRKYDRLELIRASEGEAGFPPVPPGAPRRHSGRRLAFYLPADHLPEREIQPLPRLLPGSAGGGSPFPAAPPDRRHNRPAGTGSENHQETADRRQNPPPGPGPAPGVRPGGCGVRPDGVWRGSGVSAPAGQRAWLVTAEPVH